MTQHPPLLIVEDDALIAMDAEDAAIELGYRPVVAASIAEALDIISHEEIAGALLDFRLPDGTSATLVKHLDRKKTPYLVVSGEPVETISANAIELTRIASKPADYSQLISKLRNASF